MKTVLICCFLTLIFSIVHIQAQYLTHDQEKERQNFRSSAELNIQQQDQLSKTKANKIKNRS